MALRRVEDERRERNDQVSGLFFTIFILLFGTILSFPAGAEQIGTGDDVRLEWAGAPIPGAARGLAIEHDLAYVAVTSGLQIMDITDPYSPTKLSFLSLPGECVRVIVNSGVAYVACRSGGLQIVDVRNPSAPELITGYLPVNVPEPKIFDMARKGQYLYLAADEAGLLVLDISVPGYPLKVGDFNLPGSIRVVTVDGERLGLGGENCSFHLLDLSEPGEPVEVDHTRTIDDITAIALWGDRAMVGNRHDSYEVFDLDAMPGNTRTHSGGSNRGIIDIEVSGSVAYLSNAEDGLIVVDLSDPLEPVEVRTFGNSCRPMKWSSMKTC